MSDNEIKREQPSFEVRAESLKKRTKEFFSTYENPNGSEDRLEICLIREGYRAVLMAEEEINRQKAEIENCYEFIEQLKKARNIWDDKCTHQNAEIERLQKLLDDKCDRCIAKDRAEAVKEFAERLKEELEGEYIKATNKLENAQNIVVSTNIKIVDNLVKERVGEG